MSIFIECLIFLKIIYLNQKPETRNQKPETRNQKPEGWFLTTSSIPAIIGQNEAGLTTLRFVNDRPDAIDVFIKAQRKQ